MDIITLHQLNLPITIGVNSWEKQVTQHLLLDVAMGADTRKAAQSDDVNDTIDYAQVGKFLLAFAEREPVQLVETLVNQMADALLQEYHLPWVRLQLYKPGAVTGAKSISITIERERS